MSGFDYIKATTLDEVCRILAETSNARVLAGGTDLLVKIKERRLSPSTVIDIKGIQELKDVKVGPDGVSIGACVTLTELIHHPAIKEYPVLAEGCHSIGSVQIRNRGTLAGNLCNASPLADSAPALLVYDAKVELKSTEGTRVLPLSEFFQGPSKTAIRPDEILTRVLIPPVKPHRGSYYKHARRKAVDLASVGVAAIGWQERHWQFRIALGAVAPTPMRAYQAEDVMQATMDIARAAETAQSEASPIGDLRASSHHRDAMVGVYVARALRDIVE